MKVISWRRIAAELLVHVLVLAHHFGRGGQIEAGEGIERLAQHVQRDAGHAADLDEARLQQPVAGVDQLGHARDLGGLVADALEVGDGLDHGHDHAQVAGGGLAARDDGAAVLVDARLPAR